MGKGGRGSASEATADDEFFVHIHGKKIDCRKWSRSHPGGSKALRIFKDRDATEQFDMYHSPAAIKTLELMSKSAPDATAAESAVSTSVLGVGFEALRQRLVAEGCFEPNYPDEAFKLVLTLGPGFLGARLLHSGMPALGALLIGFSFYLCGWTAHDYLHHGVIKGSSKRMVHWNNACGHALGMWQGYSVGWWRARHNTHHLVTNEDGNDPDIKTAPLLIYVRNNPAIAATLNAVQRWQQYYYVPLMSILDAYWRFESLQYLAARPITKTWPDWCMMGVHYAVLLWVFSGQMAWLPFMTLCRGFMTGIVVFATHYGEDILDGGNHGMTLVEQTALTSRNITGGHVMNVLTGYISLQTEHHLFPMMPTANLDKAQPLVRAFFKEYGLLYRESNLVECVKYNIKALEFSHLLQH